MSARRIALVVLCGFLLGTGGQAGLIVDAPKTHDPAEPDVTLSYVTNATDIGFLVEDARSLNGCSASAHCRWTGRAIPWWIYDYSTYTLDTTNVLAPGTTTRFAGDSQQLFGGSIPPSGILTLGRLL